MTRPPQSLKKLTSVGRAGSMVRGRNPVGRFPKLVQELQIGGTSGATEARVKSTGSGGLNLPRFR
jgi:hypothetical protein